MAHVVEAAGSIGGAHNLECELRLQLAQLQQDHCQVVHEEQGVHQRYSKLHHTLVAALPRVQDAHTIEEPVGDDKQEDEHHEQGTQHEDTGQRGLGPAEEQGPAAQQQDEQLEGHGNEETLAGRPTGLQLLPPEQRGQQQESQWREEGEQRQCGPRCHPQVTGAVQWDTVLHVLGDAREIIMGDAVL